MSLIDDRKSIRRLIMELSPLDVYRVLIVAQTLQSVEQAQKKEAANA